jgi:hypothetical protein
MFSYENKHTKTIHNNSNTNYKLLIVDYGELTVLLLRNHNCMESGYLIK